MQRESTVVRWCGRIIEGCWLLAVLFIPSYFNLLSARHFEPDKATSLRAIVLVMLAAAAVRWFDILSRTSSAPAPQADLPWWRRLLRYPIALPALLYSLVFLFATAISIMPATSFWGSYQRLQGTYTNLSYVAFGMLVATHLRTRAQLDRLITMLLLGSLPAIGYGLIQHFQVDPLPWQGDVVTRVASTMGNSIFVAAYLILVAPFALARSISGFQRASVAPPAERPLADLLWAAAYGMLVAGGLMLLFSAIEFAAVVRAVDLRYWWVYPGALFAAFSVFLIPGLQPHRTERIPGLFWPAVVVFGYGLLVGLLFMSGQGSGGQEVSAIPGRPGLEWPLWLVAGVACVAVGYGLIYALARNPAPPSRLMLQLQGFAMAFLAALIIVVVFFTQSRGPWIGGMAGVFVFVTIVLLIAGRRAVASNSPRASLWRSLLIAEVVLALAGGAFLLAFNMSDAPFFTQLRTVPYIGRMGKLLEIDEGTGLVRKLIWVGDEQAGGAQALILSNPIRTLVGWGPETMFVAFNPFYPPSLANIEARGASPDRSHQAYLDELINKGVLGLASYLFVLLSFFVLAWRLIRLSDDWPTQVLLAACISAVTAHAVEGLTGIPIVASLVLLWLTIGITVAVSRFMGANAQEPATAMLEPVPETAPEPATRQSAAERTRNRQRTGQRGSSQGRAAPAPARGMQSSPAAIALYILVGLGALVGAWSFNIDNVYADMRFQQGQSYTEDPQANLERYIVGSSYYIDAVRMEPNQDFYYLSLGRSLMSIVDIRRQMSAQNLGSPVPDADVNAILRLRTPVDLQEFVLKQPPLALASYTEALLLRAYELSPRNKDHSANLARMYNFWYTRLEAKPEIFAKTLEWYRRAIETAPQDVSILNEYAAAVALQASEREKAGDTAAAQAGYAEATQLLQRSQQIDPRYRDTEIRLADLLRQQGRLEEAVAGYVSALAKDPRVLDTRINTIITSLREQPELLQQMRQAYEAVVQKNPNDPGSLALIGLISARLNDADRAATAFSAVIRLQPDNLEARQNYTLVLSDQMRYREAATEAETLLTMAMKQGINQQDQTALEGLLAYLKSKVGLGP